LTLLALIVLRPGPAAADYYAPTGPTEILSAGSYHSCALTPAGMVECWGNNGEGQGGNHSGPYSQVSAGRAHTCALTPAGAVECWGDNGLGQAGNHAGSYTQISTGGYYTCALTPAGAVECWGYNGSGQAGNHAGPYSQVSAGSLHSCALTPGGAVECWGFNGSGQADTHAGSYSQVSAGYGHTCALTPGATVECWGDNADGQSGNHAGPYSQVSAGYDHTCALTPAGAVECWGDNAYGQAGSHAGPYSQVNASEYHTCALTPVGAVECWGYNGHGQAGNHAGPYGPYRPPTLPEIVSAGTLHSCALTPGGVVECWGSNLFGQAGSHAGPYTQVSAGNAHTCALTPDGAVECWGNNADGRAGNHAGPYTQVSAGYAYTCALTTGRAVECWGNNDDGQAGNHAGPYTQVSTGHLHSCALTPNGVIECWGNDTYGQAGTHTGPYTQVSAGDLYTCALTPAGTVECWGNNGDGQANGQPGPYTQVDAGDFHTCALTPAGAVKCWGRNNFSQAGNHAGPYSQVSAGTLHNCALTPEGVVECWGRNGNNEAGTHAGPYGPYVPQTSIAAAPPALTNDNNPSFSFTSDVFTATFECRLDGGAWAACTSPKAYTDLSDGEHTFEVRAVSPPGNPDTTPAAHTWTIDTAGPVVTITAAPSDPSDSPDANFEFGSETGATFECRLDGGAWTACTSPQSYTGLADDDHTFEVRATDTAGNTGPVDSHTWAIDTGALYVTAGGGSVPGAGAYQKNDILQWDGSAWSVWFDGAGRGMPASADISAFDVDDDAAGSAWIAIRKAVKLPGIGKLNPQQIAYFNGATWSRFFDGADVGLKVSGEAINGLEVLPGSVSPIGSGCLYYLLISTVAGGGVPVGATNVNFTGEDVLGFCMTSLGANTAGVWHVVFEGQAEGLAKNNNLGLSAGDDATTLYFTAKKAFTGDGGLVKPSELFSFSGGVFSGPLWKAKDHGLNQVVDGIDVVGDIP
jgi:alpha-tubulin suppressor-like RCC1 family protein